MFVPYQIRVSPPRSGAVSGLEGGVENTTSPIRNVVFPVSQTIDLLTIPVSGTKDFFLWHPFQNSLQAVYIGAEAAVTSPTPVKMQIVQRDGVKETLLTEQEQFTAFGIEPGRLPNQPSYSTDPCSCESPRNHLTNSSTSPSIRWPQRSHEQHSR